MTRSSIWTVWTVVGFLLLSRASAAGATAPSDQVLPSTTKHYLSIDLARVAEDCKKAHYAQVLYNPANLGLTFSLAQLLNNEHGELFERFGIRWTDLIAATNGEASCAIVQSAGGKHATVLLLDVSGRQEQARRLLAGAAERLKQRQAQPGQRKLGDAVLTTFTLPAYQSQRITRIGCVVNGDLLIVSDGT